MQSIHALANSRYKLKYEGHMEKWNVKQLQLKGKIWEVISW